MSMSGFKMMFPVIKVKDIISGEVHIVGTSSHDELRLDLHSVIRYYNYQTSEGTGNFKGAGYIFESIELVSLDELIRIVTKESELSAENEQKMRDMFSKCFKTFDKETAESGDKHFFHT